MKDQDAEKKAEEAKKKMEAERLAEAKKQSMGPSLTKKNSTSKNA